MKISSEWNIKDYPVGLECTHPGPTINGISFLHYRLGAGLYVWRTPDQFSVEAGQRGAGGTFYCKVKGQIVERTFTSLRSAAQYGTEIMDAYATPIAFGR